MRAQVKVPLHANFREIVGKREIVKEINLNSTLRQILDKLATKYGRDFQQIIARAAGLLLVCPCIYFRHGS